MNAILELLKATLGISVDDYNTTLETYISSAQEFIQREGITLTESDGDKLLVVAYAAWLWNSRLKTDKGEMPRLLRYNLNNRVFSEKMSEE